MDNIIQPLHDPTPGFAPVICTEGYRIGGGAAHTAEWLAGWGIPTRLSGNALGCDEYGRQVRQWLSEYPALDLSCLDCVEGVRTPVSRSVLFPDGNTYMLCFNFIGAPMRSPAPELLEGTRIVTVNFYGAVNPEPNSLEIARMARRMGILLVTTDVISPEWEALRLSTVIINSAAALRQHCPAVDPRQRVRELQTAGRCAVILTDGSREIYAIRDDGTAFSVMPPEVRAVDTTGAGDAFRAGIIYGMWNDWPLEKSVRWATATGALQVQRGRSQDRPASQEQVAALADTLIIQER